MLSSDLKELECFIISVSSNGSEFWLQIYKLKIDRINETRTISHLFVNTMFITKINISK